MLGKIFEVTLKLNSAIFGRRDCSQENSHNIGFIAKRWKMKEVVYEFIKIRPGSFENPEYSKCVIILIKDKI